MNDELNSRVRADYSQARFQAFLNRVWGGISGQPTELLSYDDFKTKLHIGGFIYRGMWTVKVEQIVGSLNRYQAFKRAFLPTCDDTSERWQRINRAFYEDISLPPVVLYKVGQVYFLVDGHHRVSVARKQGQMYIDAEVRECKSKVNITPDLKPDDLEILHDKVHFIERTGIDKLRPDADIKLTIPDGFSRMLEHIAVHRYFMGLDMQRDISEEEAVAHWYDTVYLPIVKIIRESNILKDFPGKTEGDLYLCTLDHQHDLAEERGQTLRLPEEAARDFVEGADV
ncbi:MAG: DUF4032 domain-containing protein [Anaerolineales bacterium]